MSLRMEEEMYRDLAALARVEAHSISEEIRLAISRYCVLRRDDPGFRLKALQLADEYELRAAEFRVLAARTEGQT